MQKPIKMVDGFTESAWKSLAVKAIRLGWPEGLRQAAYRLSPATMRALLYVGLVVFLLNGVLSLGYYLPLIGALFSSPPAPLACREENGERVRISTWMVCPLVFLGGLVLVIGLYPGPWLDWTADVGMYLQSLAR